MDVKESWLRVFLFVTMCILSSALMMWVAGGGALIALITSIIVSISYAYGTFQMMYLYKKKLNDAIAKLNK